MASSVLYTNFGGTLVAERRDGVYREYVSDTLGSTVAMVDEDANVTDTFEYWPYGETASRTGNTPTPFTWVGTLGYYRDSAKLFYVRMRSYLANLGGWTSVDPLWPTLQAYQYTSPLYKVDYFGLAPFNWKNITSALKKCGKGAFNKFLGNLAGGMGLASLCGLTGDCIGAVLSMFFIVILKGLPPGIDACLGGAIGAILGGIVNELCYRLTEPCRKPTDPLCVFVDSLVKGMNGCISGLAFYGIDNPSKTAKWTMEIRSIMFKALGLKERCRDLM